MKHNQAARDGQVKANMQNLRVRMTLVMLSSTFATMLVFACQEVLADEARLPFGYGPSGYIPPSSHRAPRYVAQPISVIAERSEINELLWKVCQEKHHASIIKSELASVFLRFESLLQKAANELDTGEPIKAGWAERLIADYMKPVHRFPAESKTLDEALAAKMKLVEFTDVKTVESIEKRLSRAPAPPPSFDHYYYDGDFGPRRIR